MLARLRRPQQVTSTLVVGEESGRTGTRRTDASGWSIVVRTLTDALQTMLVSVNVALRTGSRVVAAASADPFADEVFWTDGVGPTCVAAARTSHFSPLAESRLVEVNLIRRLPMRQPSGPPGW